MSMHVCIMPSWYPTPDQPLSGVFFREQAQALARAGFTVGVVAPYFRAARHARAFWTSGPRGVRITDDAGVPTYQDFHLNIPLADAVNARRWVRSGLALFARYVAEHGMPDLMHAHSAAMGGVCAAAIQQRWGVPFVLTGHSSAYARGALDAREVALARAASMAASARIVVSPALGASVEAVLGEAANPWVWVPNMVDARFFALPLAERLGTRPPTPEPPAPHPPTPHRPFTFLCIGGLHPAKGHADLIEAFAAAFPEGPRTRLRLGGEGPERAALEARIAALGMERRMELLGALTREDVARELLAADAFVLPSRIETFGVVLAEALACGLPVIATRSGGPQSIVTEADGLLVPPADAPALADALRTMREQSARYDSADIRARTLARFGEDAVVSQLAAIYADVLATRRGHA